MAEKAYPNFLIARLVAEDLLASSEVLDQEAIRKRKFPSTVPKAFEQFLTRFGADEEKVRDLLMPLAWAEGEGLPWGNIWPALASVLSGRSYGNEDVRWVMECAGSFVVEALEGWLELTVYITKRSQNTCGTGVERRKCSASSSSP